VQDLLCSVQVEVLVPNWQPNESTTAV